MKMWREREDENVRDVVGNEGERRRMDESKEGGKG
jgi:hypothetical protein